jgi:hypothetical protein
VGYCENAVSGLVLPGIEEKLPRGAIDLARRCGRMRAVKTSTFELWVW